MVGNRKPANGFSSFFVFLRPPPRQRFRNAVYIRLVNNPQFPCGCPPQIPEQVDGGYIPDEILLATVKGRGEGG